MKIWNKPQVRIMWHDCSVGFQVFGRLCPLFMFGYKKWCGATIIQFLQVRILIGEYK